MPFANSGAAAIHYETHGDGPAVVFAHGAGGNTLSWWQQVRHFAASYRVILYDHRGFGRSTCPAGEVDAKHFAGDLLALLDAAGVDRAALVCQSMGGFTGLRFAVRHPERVSALVMAGTPGGAETPLAEEDRRRVMERLPVTPRLERVLSRGFLQREPALAELYSQISGLNPAGATEAAITTLWNERVPAAALAALRLPVLFVVGDEDWFVRVESIRDLAARIPGARLRVLPGVGHSTYFEAAETFNGVVGEFLADSGASPRLAA